jgi:spermidine synthase
MAQWIGGQSEVRTQLLIRTFLSVFPDATLWATSAGARPEGHNFVLIGGTGPLRLERRRHEQRLRDEAARRVLAASGGEPFPALLSLYRAGPDELRGYAGAGPLLTDDRPSVEYFLSLPRDERPADLEALRGDVSRHIGN